VNAHAGRRKKSASIEIGESWNSFSRAAMTIFSTSVVGATTSSSVAAKKVHRRRQSTAVDLSARHRRQILHDIEIPWHHIFGQLGAQELDDAVTRDVYRCLVRAPRRPRAPSRPPSSTILTAAARIDGVLDQHGLDLGQLDAESRES